MINILINILIGFIIGLIARALKPGNDKMGFLLTTSLGILGSVLASVLGQAIGIYNAGEPAGFIASVVGAIILLSLISYVKGNKS